MNSLVKIYINERNIQFNVKQEAPLFLKIKDDSLTESNSREYDIYLFIEREILYCSISEKFSVYKINNIIFYDIKEIVIDKSSKVEIADKEFYICANGNIDSNIDTDVKLPFAIPKYCTYPMFTAMQGIMKGYNKDKTWIYNNYILLWADKRVNSSAYWTDFKFADEAIQEEFCPCIVKRNRSYYDNNEDFIGTVKKYVDNKIYAMFSIDMYNVEAWWKENETRYHHIHQILIHGYNQTEKVFYTADFYRGKYQICKLSFEDVLAGYFSNDEGENEFEKNFSCDVLLKYQEAKEQLDLNRISKLIEDFLESKDNALLNYLNICKSGMVSYGMEFIKELRKYMKSTFFSGDDIDIRPIQLLYEMNEIMLERMKFLEDEKLVILNNEDIYIIEKCLKECIIIRNNVIKCQLMGNQKKLFERIDSGLEKLYLLEKDMLKRCYFLLNRREYKPKELIECSIDGKEIYQVAKKLLADEITVNNILIDIEKSCYRKVIRTLKAKDEEIFPFGKELLGEEYIGEEKNEFVADEFDVMFWYDIKGNIIMKEYVSSEYGEYYTLIKDIFKYSENMIIRYSYSFDRESEKYIIIGVTVFELKNAKFYKFCKIGKNLKSILGAVNYEGNKIQKVDCYETEDGKSGEFFSDLYLYERNEIKQIIREKDGECNTVYPLYGDDELDYNKLKMNMVETLKKMLYIYSDEFVELYININPSDSIIRTRMEWSNNIEEEKFYFMKHYLKDSLYSEKLTLFVIQAIEMLKNEGLFVMKEKNDCWKIIVECDNVLIKIFSKYEDKEMEYFMNQ